MGGVMELTSEKAHTAGRKNEDSIRHLVHAGFSLVGATHRGCIAVVGLGDKCLAPLGHRSGGSSGPERLNRERQRLQAATRMSRTQKPRAGRNWKLEDGARRPQRFAADGGGRKKKALTQNLSDGRCHFAWQWSSWFTGNFMKLLREMSATFPGVLLEHLWSPGAALSQFLFSTRPRHLPTAFAKLFCTAFVVAIHQPHQSARSCGRYKFHSVFIQHESKIYFTFYSFRQNKINFTFHLPGIYTPNEPEQHLLFHPLANFKRGEPARGRAARTLEFHGLGLQRLDVSFPFAANDGPPEVYCRFEGLRRLDSAVASNNIACDGEHEESAAK
ncbi:hypothetical protein C8J57DRAFT_1459018 [Mycena rebaudengoi]|nr:hypothetical protein C8J57DRAFT_1459018 [Mycena rebaudengoi]